MVVLLEGSPILHRGPLELCQSDHWVLGHLPDQGPSPLIAQFGLAASSRKGLGGSKVLPLNNDEATVFLGIFNAAEMFWYPSPDLCLDTILSRALRTIPSISWLGFCSDMHCQLRDLIQTGVCLSKSCPISAGGLQLSCRNISRIINRNRMHLSLISSLIAKGLNT